MIAEYFRHTVRRKHETIEQFKKARVVFSKAWTFITLNIHILCGSQSAKSLQTDRIILFLTHFESSFIRRKFLFLSLSLSVCNTCNICQSPCRVIFRTSASNIVYVKLNNTYIPFMAVETNLLFWVVIEFFLFKVIYWSN
jgi:hypothetical protein